MINGELVRQLISAGYGEMVRQLISVVYGK